MGDRGSRKGAGLWACTETAGDLVAVHNNPADSLCRSENRARGSERAGTPAVTRLVQGLLGDTRKAPEEREADRLGAAAGTCPGSAGL